jgi:hypothetical protein
VILGLDFKGATPMRFVITCIFVIAALWLGDMIFFKGRYANEVWLEANRQMRDLNYSVRRWTRF